MLPMFLAIVDQTIVASALPAISASLGSPDRVSWVVIGYLVAATIAAPIAGTLGDVFGRRRVMLGALITFSVASFLCAFAESLEVLIFSRVIQGLGGGALATSSHALIGETVRPRERGRYQGYLASVVVIASTSGPVIGGILTANFGWRAVFLFGIPFATAAMLLALRLPTGLAKRREWRLDYGGLLLFVAFVVSFLLALDWMRTSPTQWSMASTLLLGSAVASLLLLVVYERRRDEPLIPFDLLRVPAICLSNALAFFHGAALVSLVAMLPMYLRVVVGMSIETAALMLVPLTAGIGIGSLIAGRLVSRTGHTALLPSISLIIATVAILILSGFVSTIGVRPLTLLLALIGISMGPTMAVVQLTVQVSAGPSALGVAAGFVQFSRSVGAALGTAVTSAVLFTTVALWGDDASTIFANMIAHGRDAGDTEAKMVAATAFQAVFLTDAFFTSAATLLAWRIPLRRV